MNTLKIMSHNYCELSEVAKEFLSRSKKAVAKKAAQSYEYIGAGANLPVIQQKAVTNTYFSPTALIDQNNSEVAKFCNILG